MEEPQESLFTLQFIAVLIAGFVMCAFLFYEMMNFADAGNLILVILTSIAIALVAVVILKFVKYQQIKRI